MGFNSGFKGLTHWISDCTKIGYTIFDYPANKNFHHVYS